jgi:mRNA turnover protein 4
MVRGVPTLAVAHELCRKGKELSSEQAQLLKLMGVKMVVFRVGLLARWDSATGQVEQVADGGISVEEKVDGAEEGRADEMSE